MRTWKVKLQGAEDKLWYTRFVKAETGEEAGKKAFEEVGFACDDITAEQVERKGKNSTLPQEKLARLRAQEEKKLTQEKYLQSANKRYIIGIGLILVSLIGFILCFRVNMSHVLLTGYAVDDQTLTGLFQIIFGMCFVAYFGCNQIAYANELTGRRWFPIQYLCTLAIFAIPFMAIWNTIFGLGETKLNWEARKFLMVALIPWVVVGLASTCIPIIVADPWRKGEVMLNLLGTGMVFTIALIPALLTSGWLAWKYWTLKDLIPNWHKPTFWGIWFWAFLPVIIWWFTGREGSREKEKE